MKRVFKANLEKPESELSTNKSVLTSFGRIVFYTEKHPKKEPGFEFISLYPAINQTKVWQSDSQGLQWLSPGVFSYQLPATK